MLFGIDSRNRQNDCQEHIFERLSGIGYRSRQNYNQEHRFSSIGSRSRHDDRKKHRFEDVMALAPEVNKMIAKMIDLGAFWHQKTTK